MHDKLNYKKVIAGFLAAACLGASLSAWAAEEVRHFDINAGSLSQALMDFGIQSGLTVVAPSALTVGKKGAAVQGEMSPTDALARLLQGSGLAFTRGGDGTTIAIQAAGGRIAIAEPVPGAEPVQANDGESNLAEDLTDENKISEIIVTAQKREERLQDVPVSVTAITGEQLKERGAVDIKDVLGSVPGLSYSNADRGQSRYTIRGVSSDVDLAATTGVYLDDVSLISANTFFAGATDILFLDTERVEVLKGPQGTLYGGSTMGGAIKYVSTPPDASKFAAHTAAGFASTAHGDLSYNAQGVVNLPIVDDVLAMRAGVSYLREGGYIDNIPNLNISRLGYSGVPYPGYAPLVVPSGSTVGREDYNSSDSYAGKVSLLWQPDPSFSLRVNALYQKSTSDNPGYILPGQELVSSFRFVHQPTPDKVGVYSVQLSKQWSAVELTSLTSYVDRQADWNRDYTFSVTNLRPSIYSLNTSIHNPNHSRTESQEIRLSSAPADGARLKWLTGFYYSKRTSEHDPTLISTPGAGYAAGSGFPADTFIGQVATEVNYERALFGELTYSILPSLDFAVGARRYILEGGNQVPSVTFLGFVGGVTVITAPLRAEEQGTNPKASLSYKIDRDHLLYASAAKGFRSGAPLAPLEAELATPQCVSDLNRLGFSGYPTAYQSDSVWTYELGSKNQFSNRATVNGAIFYTDWSDIQQAINLSNCGGGFTTNAGRAEVKGVELEAKLNLLPGLQVGTALTYLDAKIVAASSVGVTLPVGTEVLDTPKWTSSTYASYLRPLTAQWEIELRADYQRRNRQRRAFADSLSVRYPDDSAPADVFPTAPYPFVYQAGYHVASASVAVDNGSTTIRLLVRNLFDAAPVLDAATSGGFVRAATIRPRTVGIQVEHQF